MVASPLLVPLALSFILSPLKFSIKPFDIGNSNNNSSNGIVFSLLSSNRNISFSLKHGFLFADLTQINQNKSDQNLMVSISCLNDFSLNLEVNNDSKTIPSPSLCTPSDDKNSKTFLTIFNSIFIDSMQFPCISKVTLISIPDTVIVIKFNY